MLPSCAQGDAASAESSSVFSPSTRPSRTPSSSATPVPVCLPPVSAPQLVGGSPPSPSYDALYTNTLLSNHDQYLFLLS